MLTVTLPTGPGDAAVLRPDGELDLSHVDALWAAIEELLAARPGCLVIDLDAVTFCDSSVLGVFVRAERAGAAQDVRVVLRRPRSNVRRVLQLSGLDLVVTVDDGDPV